MEDLELEAAVTLGKAGDGEAARKALTEISRRLRANRALPPAARAAVADGITAVGAPFLSAQKRRGRPPGAGKTTTLHKALRDYGAAKGYLPEDRATVGPRSLQRLRAQLQGPGKPGRPKKSDK